MGVIQGYSRSLDNSSFWSWKADGNAGAALQLSGKHGSLAQTLGLA